MKRTGWCWVLAVIAGALVAGAADHDSSRQVEWPYYGGDQGGMKFSSLTDINASNVSQLRVVWQWKHWETAMPEYGTMPGFFEATPLMLDGVLCAGDRVSE